MKGLCEFLDLIQGIILFLALFHLRPGWCAAQVKPCSVLFSLDFYRCHPYFLRLTESLNSMPPSWPCASSSSTANSTRLLDDDGAAPAAQPARPADGQVAAVQARVNEVQAVMRDNVNSMVDNMERASNLENASANLADQAQRFQAVSRQTRRMMWWRNVSARQCCVLGGSFTSHCLLRLLLALRLLTTIPCLPVPRSSRSS